MGADGIDINMGCPAAKVVSSCHGAALIKHPELAAELVYATKKAVSIPVSVKTRLGWDTVDTLIPFCKVLEEAGVDAFAIHGTSYVRPPIQPIPLDRTLAIDETFVWHGRKIACLDTRGTTCSSACAKASVVTSLRFGIRSCGTLAAWIARAV